MDDKEKEFDPDKIGFEYGRAFVDGEPLGKVTDVTVTEDGKIRGKADLTEKGKEVIEKGYRVNTTLRLERDKVESPYGRGDIQDVFEDVEILQSVESDFENKLSDFSCRMAEIQDSWILDCMPFYDAWVATNMRREIAAFWLRLRGYEIRVQQDALEAKYILYKRGRKLAELNMALEV